MGKKQRVQFFKTITKDLTVTDSDRRLFEGLLTVEMVDKQNEITIVDELMKALPLWAARGAPISDTHSNRIIGKGLNFQKTTVEDDGNTYPAILIQGEIFKDYELDNEIWDKIKSGEYKGLSFGGATRSDRQPVRNKDGSISYALSDLEHYEVAVCEDPAVPLALITNINRIAKANISKDTNITERGNGSVCIRCTKFGCYVDKWMDVKYTDKDPSKVDKEPDKSKDPQGQEWTTTDGNNKPYPFQEDPPAFKANKPKPKPATISAGKQEDVIGQCTTLHSTGLGNPGGQGSMGETAVSGMNSGLGKDACNPKNSVQEIIGSKKDSLNPTPKEDEKVLVPMCSSSTETHEIIGDDLDAEVKTITPGENLVTEKPIRGIRGTGGERGFDPIAGKAYLHCVDGSNLDKYGSAEYCVVGVHDGHDCDEAIEEAIKPKKKEGGIQAQTMSGANSEDGVKGKVRVGIDGTAEALRDEDADPEGLNKEGIFVSGVKGSYETFQQDPGDNRQISAREQKPKRTMHGRDETTTSNGHEDDGYSLGKIADLETVKIRLKLLALKSV